MAEAFNAADPKQVRERERKVRRTETQWHADLQAVLKLPEGRRVLWHLLDHCGLYRTPFDPNGSKMNFNAGTHNVALYILAEITAVDEEALFTMMRENRT